MEFGRAPFGRVFGRRVVDDAVLDSVAVGGQGASRVSEAIRGLRRAAGGASSCRVGCSARGLSVEKFEALEPRLLFSGDTIGTATALSLMQDPSDRFLNEATVARAVTDTGDVDYWSFDALAGDSVGVTLSAPQGDLTALLTLRDASDNVLATSSDGTLSFTPGLSGTYFVRIDPTGGTVGEYGLTVGVGQEVEALGSPGAVSPLGAFVSEREIAGSLVDGADESRFTVNVDAGQTLGVLLRSVAAGLSVEVLDGSGAVIGSFTTLGGGSGQFNGSVASGGEHVVVVRSADGSAGQFTGVLTVNGLVEAEGDSSGLNDEVATAESLEGSFLPADGSAGGGATVGTADRAVVIGSVGEEGALGLVTIPVSDPFSLGNVRGLTARGDGTFYITDGSALYTIDSVGQMSFIRFFDFGFIHGLAFNQATGQLFGIDSGGVDLYEIDPVTGEQFNTIGLFPTEGGENGLFSPVALAFDPTTGELYGAIGTNFFGRSLVRIDVSTGEVTTIGGFSDSISSLAFDNTGRLFGVTGRGANTPRNLWEISRETAGLTQLLVLDADPFSFNGGEGLAFDPLSGLLFRGYSSGPTQFQSIDLTPTAADGADVFTFEGLAGEAVSIVVSGRVGVELLDASGAVLALGLFGSGGVDRRIDGFVPSVSGTFAVRVTSPDGGREAYRAVVVRGAGFEAEPNSVADGAQRGSEGVTLGFVGEGIVASGDSGTPTPITLGRTLTDGAGFVWDVQTDGSINNGTVDAFDGGFRNNAFGGLFNATLEADGREIVIGPIQNGSIQTVRKIFVSPTGQFTRFLEIVTNTGGTAATASVQIRSNLGSGTATQVVGTSTGDGDFTADDLWIVSDDASSTGGDPVVTHVVAGAGGQGPSAASRVNDQFNYDYQLDLAPGETKIVMHFGSQSADRGAALSLAEALAGLTDASFLLGMTAEELTRVVNFDLVVSDTDRYLLEVAGPTTLTIGTATPDDGLAGVGGGPDVRIRLIGPGGVEVAADDNSGVDGRNALLSFVVTEPGVYEVIVEASGRGAYALEVSSSEAGAIVGRAAPEVVTSSVQEGSVLRGLPAFVTLGFSEAVLLSTVEAGDLSVVGPDGTVTPASGVSVVDGRTLRFDFGGVSLSGDGPVEFRFEPGAVTGLDGQGAGPFSVFASVDSTGPSVVSVMTGDGELVVDGGTLPAGPLTLVVEFDQDLDAGVLDAGDAFLFGPDGALIAASALSYDAATRRLTVEYGPRAEGAYFFTLRANSSAGIVDPFGNPLLGFGVSFSLDVRAEPLPTPFASVAPGNSLIYFTRQTGAVSTLDEDSFTVTLDAGQRVTVLLETSSPTLVANVELRGPDGSTILGERATGPGGTVLLQSLLAEVAGEYTVVVLGAEGEGAYGLTVALNAAAELEGIAGGGSNDDLAGAESLDPSFAELLPGSGVAGERAGVVGELVVVSSEALVSIPLSNAFELGNVRGMTTNGMGGFYITDGSNLFELTVDGQLNPCGSTSPFIHGLAFDEVTGTLYGIDQGGTTLFELDPATGDVLNSVSLFTNDSENSIFNANALALDALTGEFYAVMDFAIGGRSLARIDFSTGEVFPIGTLGVNIASLAFDDTGRLFGVSGRGAFPSRQLFEILTSDAGLVPQTFVPTDLSPNGGEGLVFNIADGRFYRAYGSGPTVYESFDLTPTPAASEADVYSFSLLGGESASIAVSGAVVIELLDAAGNVLAIGAPGASGVSQRIDGFVAPADGTFFVRLTATGDETVDYSVVVTRNAGMDNDPTEPGATQQGRVGLTLASTGGGVVQSSATTPVSLGTNLFDAGGFRWDIQGDGDIGDGTSDAFDGGFRLSGFGFFGSGQAEENGREIVIGPSVNGQVSTVRKIFVPADGQFARFLEIVTNTGTTATTATVRIDTNLGSDGNEAFRQTSSGDPTFLPGDRWVVTDDGSETGGDPVVTHVVAGVGATGPTTAGQPSGSVFYSYEVPLAPGETRVVMHFGTQTRDRTLSVELAERLSALDDPSAFLAGMSAAELSALFNFEVAVADRYEVEVTGPTTLTVSTTTPGGGPGEFVNDLDPVIRLIGPDGSVVAMDDNGGADGRNALVSFSVPGPGVYVVEVEGVSRGGPYVVNIEDSAGAVAGPRLRAEAVTPAEGAEITGFPATYTVRLSTNVLLSSVEASDLVVVAPDGTQTAATGVRVIDGRTLEFDIAGAAGVDGVYEARLAPGAIVGVDGSGVEAFVGTFDADASAPVVVASSIAAGAVVPPGPLVYQVEFGERLAATDIGPEDVVLRNLTTGETFAPASFVFGTPRVEGVTATATSSLDGTVSGFNRPVGNLVDGVGATTTAPDGSPGTGFGMWLSAGTGFVAATDADPAVTLDLGSVLAIDRLEVFNYNEPNFLNRGVATFELFVSDDNFVGDVRSLGVFTLGRGSGNASNPGQLLDLGGVEARYLRLDILTNHNGSGFPGGLNNIDNNFVGLSEVGVFAAAPGSAADRTATIGFEGLSEGDYELVLRSDATGFRDRRGNLLDGSPSDPLPSGDGAAGDDFVLSFVVDADRVALITPLVAEGLAPTGSQLFGGFAEGFLTNGDVDSFTVLLQPGQTLSVLVGVEAGLLGRVSIIGPDGSVAATADASAVGESVALRTVAVSSAGEYTVVVESLDGQGGYTVDLLLNADLSPELGNGPSNGTFEAAQSLAGSSFDQRNGSVTQAVRGELGGTEAFYLVALEAGQVLSAALGFEGGVTGLELIGPDGTLLAIGAGVVGGRRVDGFVAPAAGEYRLRVTGEPGAAYALVLSLFGQIEVEPNEAPGQAQRLVFVPQGDGSQVARVVGGIGEVSRSIDPDNFPENASLANPAVGVSISIVGSNGVTVIDSPIARATGLSSTGRLTFGGAGTTTFVSSRQLRVDFAFGVSEVSVDVIGDDGFDPGILRAFDAAGNLLATSLGFVTPGGNPQTLTINRPQGDIAFILVSGQGGDTAAIDNLVIGGDPLDAYVVSLSPGDEIEVVSQTPNDGTGEPMNGFDPVIELLDASGFLVATNDNGQPDGRNARVVYTVPPGGAGDHLIRVLSQSAGGYSLEIRRTASAASADAPSVVGFGPADGSRVASAPSFIDVTFSEAIRADSVGVGDLVIGVPGASVLSAELIGSNVVRFAVDIPGGEGPVGFTVPAGAVIDLQGNASAEGAGSFLIDQTGPRVIAQSPVAQASAPFNRIVLTFDEPLDASSVSVADVLAFTGPTGSSLLNQVTGVTVNGSEVTITFVNQLALGQYRLEFGPGVLDSVGNAMDQSGDGVGGQADDRYVAEVTVQSPDLTVGSVIAPTAAVFGQQVEISWTVTNVGTDPAVENWSDRVWLSADSTVNAFDTLLGTFAAPVDTLEANGSYTRTVTVTLPLTADTQAGSLRFLVQTDAFGQQPETNEANNTAPSAVAGISLPATPDLVVTGIVAPAEALSNSAITISWTLTNQGAADFSGTFLDRVFLSPDAFFGGDTLFGSFEFTGTIAAGESVVRTQTITLPQTLDAPRFVIVRTDATDAVLELGGGENNNAAISAAAIDVRLAPFPNLTVASVTAPAELFSGQGTQVNWVVTNTGTAPTDQPSWIDQVWLSTDTVFDAGDRLLGQAQNVSFLDVNGSYQNSLNVTIPQGLSGTFFFIVRTDAGSQVFEFEAEGDNTAASAPAQVEVPPLPDLIVTDVDTQSLAFSGTRVEVSYTVSNRGEAALRNAAFTDRIFLSMDRDLGTGDTLLATVNQSVTELLVNGDIRRTVTVTLPERISGEFFMIVQTDTGNQVFENFFEGNNVGADETPIQITLTPPADLEVESVEVPAQARAGAPVTVNYRVTNFGVSAIPGGAWTDRLYLSADGVFDPNQDTLIATRSQFGPLASGESYDAGFTASLPNGISGAFTFFVVSDFTDLVFELDNANNILGSAPVPVVSLLPNLRPTAVSTSAVTAQNGDTLTVNWTVANTGVGDTIVGGWTDRVFLTRSGVIDAFAVQLASVARSGALNPGESYDSTVEVAIPFTTEPGSFQIVVRTDVFNGVFEGGAEGDNDFAVPLAITQQLPDLRVTGVQTDNPAPTAGDAVNVTWTVANFGPEQTNANFWSDTVWLSTDATLGGGDIALGSFQRNNALPGFSGLGDPASYTTTRAVTIPSTVSGPFFIIVQTDSGNQVFEGVLENNNALATAGVADPNNPGAVLPPVNVDPNPTPVVRPDLVVSSVTIPAGATSGQLVQVSFTVTNNGDPAAVVNWFDSVFLSRDQVFDRNADAFLGTLNAADPTPAAPGLGTGESYTQTVSFRIPAGLAGPFYVVVASDAGARVTEANEFNNVGFSQTLLDVALPAPVDLVAGDIVVPANADLGGTVSITYTVSNGSSQSITGSWTDTLYISSDDVWDLGDAVFGSAVVSETLNANGSYTRTVTAQIPGVLPGEYRVIVRSDIRNQVIEAAEANNIAASVDTVLLDAPALTLGVPVTATPQAGQPLFYRVDVAEGEALLVTLDSDNPAAVNEVYIGFERVPTRADFDFGFSSPLSADQRSLVGATQAGTYYVLVFPAQAPGGQTLTVEADTVEFSVFNENLGRGGNTGLRTVRIDGARFDRSVVAALTDAGGARIEAVSYFRTSSNELFATFDLRGVALGEYDFVLTKASTGETATVAAGFEVVPGGPGISDPGVVAPGSFVRARQTPLPITVSWGNDTLNDALVPIINFAATEPFGTSFSDLASTGGSLARVFLGVPTTDLTPPGVLIPGSGGSASFVIVPLAFTGTGVTPIDYAADYVFTDDTAAFDWATELLALDPGLLSPEEFEATAAAFIASVGGTVGDYRRVLTEGLTLLGGVPDNRLEVASPLLVQAVFDRFAATVNQGIVGTIDYLDFDIDFAGLSVFARNLTTGSVFRASVATDGSFAMPRVEAGEYAFFVTGGGVNADASLRVTVAQGAPASVVVPLARGASASGRVVDASGVPIAGATIAAALIQPGLNFSPLTTASVADGSGSFTLTDLPEGEYQITLDAPGFEAFTLTITVPASGLDLGDVTLEQGAVVSGVITALGSGDPIEGATVTAVRTADGLVVVAITDGNGAYTLDGLPEGDWTLSFDHPAFIASGPAPITISGESTLTINTQLDTGASISGVVLRPDGAPAAGAAVRVLVGGVPLAPVATGDDGSFTIQGVPEGVEVVVEADTAGFAPGRVTLAALSDNQTLTGVSLSLTTALTIAGSALDASGQPVAGAFLSLTPPNGGPPVTVALNADGSFVVDDLEAGLYTLIATAPGFTSAPVAVDLTTADATGLSVLLLANATVTVTVLDDLGFPVPAGFVAAITDTTPDQQVVLGFAAIGPNGTAVLNVPAGDYILVAVTEFAFSLGTSVSLESGALSTATVSFPSQAISSLDIFLSDDFMAEGRGDTGPAEGHGMSSAIESLLLGTEQTQEELDRLRAELQEELALVESRLGIFSEGFARFRAQAESLFSQFEQAVNFAFTPIPPTPTRPNIPQQACNFFVDPNVVPLAAQLDAQFRQLEELTREAGIFTVGGLRLDPADDFFRQNAIRDFGRAAGGFDAYRQNAESLIGSGISLIGAIALIVTPEPFSTAAGAVGAAATIGGGLLALRQLFTGVTDPDALGRNAVDSINGMQAALADVQRANRIIEENRQRVARLINDINTTIAQFNAAVARGTMAPVAVNVTRSARVGTTVSGNALASQLGNLQNLDFTVEVRGSLPPGASLDSRGNYTATSSTERTVTILYDLVIDCDDGPFFAFGFLDTEIRRTGVITINFTEDEDDDRIDEVISRDPNDILGPVGFGEQNWIAADQPLNYTIRFENDAELASAPAQVVRVTQTLDSDLDPRTFRLGSFGFGEFTFQVPENSAAFSTRLDLREQFGIFVDVAAGIDVTTGEAFWELRSVDPDTGDLPADPLLGFLPPNIMPPEGDGFVTYSVRADRNVASGAVVDAEARIVFDVNEPIDTPPIFNTLDAGRPFSQVAALPATSASPEFLVSWSGGDDENGSGLASYDIFVSVDGGAFELFLENTALTEALFSGELGRTYAFFSVARDNAGNAEAPPATPDATISIPRPNSAPAIEPQAFSVPENSPAGTVVGSVLASDPDTGFGDSIAFAITAGNESGAFAIDEFTGEITVADPTALDFEAGAGFTLTVSVTDSFGESAQAEVAVAVSDVNEAPSIADAAFDLDENSAPGAVVGSVLASDPDAGDQVRYSITSGNPSGVFAIDELTGEITVLNAAALDFESFPEFILTIAAADLSGLGASATVTIALRDVNEAPAIADASFTIPENSPLGSVVGSVVASDPDAGDQLRYTITAGNESGAFAIDELTGEITVADPAALDFEAQPAFSLTVAATDLQGLSREAAVSIALTDVQPPQVLEFIVNDGSAQRSLVRSLTVVFDSPVTLEPGAFALSLRGLGTLPASGTLSADGTRLTLDFGSAGLADGVYDLLIVADRVRGLGGEAMTLGRMFTFHRLGGDIDGDGDADAIDLRGFRGRIGATVGTANYSPAFDLDGDGDIDNDDYFAARLNARTRFVF